MHENVQFSRCSFAFLILPIQTAVGVGQVDGQSGTSDWDVDGRWYSRHIRLTIPRPRRFTDAYLSHWSASSHHVLNHCGQITAS